MSTQKWNAEIVVSAIEVRHKNDEPLNSNHVQQECSPLYQAACKYHGSWKAAVEAAGISYDSVKIKVPNRKVVWTKDIILEKIKTRHKNDEPLNSNYIQQNECRLYGAACKYFGSWAAAVEAAGISYDSAYVGVRAYWSKELVIQRIKTRATEGKSIGLSAVTKEESSLAHAAKRFFASPQSWRKARVAAGFSQVDEHPLKKWNQQTVIEEIQKLHKKGISLNVASMQQGELSKLRGAGCKYFGSWAAAVEAAGLDYEVIRKVRSWTKKKVRKKIKKLAKKGFQLSSKNIQELDSGLFGAAISYFGSWAAAVEAAGISYRRHCKVWSTKAWLRRITNEEYKQKLECANIHSKTIKRRKK